MIEEIVIFVKIFVMERINTLKKNQPELLVDFNGNPVQSAWMIGGKTITVTDGKSFIAETTLFKVTNTGDAVVRIKVKNADYSSIPTRNKSLPDVGLPVLPKTTMSLGVQFADTELLVSGGNLDVTFVPDFRLKLTTDKISYPSFKASVLTAYKEGEETGAVVGNTVTFTGMIPYSVESKVLGRVAGNRVGVCVTPAVDVTKFPYARFRFYNDEDIQPVKEFGIEVFDDLNGKKVLNYWPLVKSTGVSKYIVIDWTGDGSVVEKFEIVVSDKATLQNG